MKSAVFARSLSIVLLSAVTAGAGGPALDFDRGVLAPAGLLQAADSQDVPLLDEILGLDVRWVEGCRDFSVPDNGRSGELPAATLSSELKNFSSCGEEYPTAACATTLWIQNRTVVVSYSGRRRPFPWENPWGGESFRVCLDHDALSARSVNSSTQYEFRFAQTGPGGAPWAVTAVGGERNPSRPDPRGLEYRDFGIAANPAAFTLSVADRWAEYYPASDGERIEIELRVNRKDWTGDKRVVERTELLPTGPEYSFRFDSGFREDVRSGREYDATWRFRRIGSVSTREWSGWQRAPKRRMP